MEKYHHFNEEESRSYAITKHDDITNQNETIAYIKFKKISINDCDHDTKSGTLLYNDYAWSSSGHIFYEITDIYVKAEERRKGHGTFLLETFFAYAKDTPILVQAGLSRYDFSEQQFEEKYKDGTLLPYIYENIVPFFEKNGFTDVNNTILGYENVVTMIKNNPYFCK